MKATSGVRAPLIRISFAGSVHRGGVRKLRWGMTGRGKRGGLRVIYYLRRKPGQIWMLTLYGKNAQENIPAHVLRQMKEAIDDGKVGEDQEYRSGDSPRDSRYQGGAGGASLHC